MFGEKKTSLPRAASPEEVGVSSKAIADFIEDLNQNDIETHSLLFLRHGKVAYEYWAEPYGPDIPHIMYSVSKSFTATAIGFAIEEGLLTLDTRVIDIFPEYRPSKPDKNLEKLTVYHLVTMTAGKDVGTLSDKSKNHWIQDFFDSKWAFAPGEGWRYISENTFMLSAMLTRITGQTLTEYLMPRLFEPLGYDRKPFWETDGYGIEAGGWGLYITTEELAKFMLCYSQGGVFNGKQVIPARWTREAGKKQVENFQYTELASTAGYGYGFWRNPIPDSYRADGLFSQFGIVFEKYDACFVMTSSEMFEEKARDCLWRHFPGIFTDESAVKADEKPFNGELKLKSMPNLPKMPRSRLERKIDGKILKIKKDPLLTLLGMPVSMLITPVLQMNTEKLGLEEVRFEFHKDECVMTWREDLYKNTIVCGMDGKPRNSKIRMSQFHYTANSTATWENEQTLCVWMRPLEAVGQRRLRFVFSDNKVEVIPGGVPDAKTMMDYISSFVCFFVKGPVIIKGAQFMLSKADRFLEIKHSGKIR